MIANITITEEITVEENKRFKMRGMKNCGKLKFV
jgi:hypothetical protein